MVSTVPGIAVLIDTQNISHALLPAIFTHVDKLGPAGVRRAYGDWSRPEADAWKSHLLEFALTPMQQFDNVAHKNAVDIALVIDAMDILYSGRHSGFCIVSNDSDFSALATRIRQAGVKVFGIGTGTAPLCFRNACSKFLLIGPDRGAKPVDQQVAAELISETAAKPASPQKAKPKSASVSLPNKAALTKTHLEKIRQAILANRNKEGWASLSQVGDSLRGKMQTKNHAGNLTKLLRVSGIAELGGPKSAYDQHVRLKAA